MLRLHRFVWPVVAAGLSCGPLWAAAAEVFPLGRGSERALSRGAIHAYPVDLRTGEALHVVVEQLGLDVEIRLADPRRKRLLRVDSPNGAVGTEELFFVAVSPGRYRVEIAAWEEASGVYRISVATVRPATADDRRRALALATFCHGRELDGPASTAGEAAAAYRRAANLWRQPRDRIYRLEALRRLADLLANAGGMPAAALPIYGEILAAHQRSGDRRGQAVIRSDIAECHLDMGDPDAARADGEPALAAWRRLGDSEGIAKALHILGEAARQTGDLQRALSFFGEELEKAPSRERRARALIALAVVLTAVGDGAAAQERCEQALALLEGPGGTGTRAQVLTQLGNAYFDRGAPYDALSVLRRAWLIQRKSATVEPSDLAVTMTSLGRVYFKLGDFKSAEEYHRKALQLFVKAGKRAEEASVWNNLGWIALLRRHAEAALSAFQQVLPLARSHHFRDLEATVLLGMARAERLRGSPIAGRARIEGALDLIEAMRDQIVRPALQISFFEKKEDYYAFAIDFLMEQYRQQPASDSDVRAFAISERSRSRTLLDRLSVSGGGPPRPLSLPEVQREVLDGHTSLLEIHLGEPKSYLWVVSSRSSASFELPGREAIERQARHTLAALSSRASSPLVVKARLAELSRSLLAPVAGQLGDQRLLFVADGALQAVPFAALSDPDVRGGWTPLLLRHEVVTLPSASVLAALRRRAATRPPAPHQLAVIGDAVIGEDDLRLPVRAPRMPGPLEGGSLVPLPFVKQEIDSIVKLVPSRDVLKLVGFDADREHVIRDRLAGYGIVHFATHGLFDEWRPERSALVLSRFDPAGSLRRGLLGVEDIESMRLGADLVVLSACETARGREVRGEGVIGLTRSFLAAGADRVLVSLWKVDDRATAVLMERFYRKLLGEGRPAAAALREAQLSMWREERWGRPYQWAGFLLQGNWN